MSDERARQRKEFAGLPLTSARHRQPDPHLTASRKLEDPDVTSETLPIAGGPSEGLTRPRAAPAPRVRDAETFPAD